MKNIKLIAAAFLTVVAIITVTATVKASAATTPSLSVNNIYNGAKTVTGKATKGVYVTVRDTKKNKLGRTVASKTTGKYTVKLSKKLKTNTKVYVYARAKGAKNFFYRIIHVQASSSKATTTSTKNSKSSTTTTSSKKVTKVSPATPTGTWNSNTVNGYKIRFTFSQKTGFTSKVLKSGKSKTITSNATYKVTPKATNFWKITTKAHSGKVGTFYMRFTTNKKFKLVNSKNQVVKTTVGNAPKAVYTFSK